MRSHFWEIIPGKSGINSEGFSCICDLYFFLCAIFHSHQQYLWVLVYLHLQELFLCIFFHFIYTRRCEICYIVMLICISQIANVVKHRFRYLLSICLYTCSYCSPILKMWTFSYKSCLYFLRTCPLSVYKVWVHVCSIHDLQIFFCNSVGIISHT